VLIRYRSLRYRPPHRISCDLTAHDESLLLRLEGAYRDQTWLFEAPDDLGWTGCRLRLDGQLVLTERQRPDQGALSIVPADEKAPAIWVDNGRLQQAWFDEGLRDEARWDVIVVGQGMGGGMLHAALVDRIRTDDERTLAVLGLEAGGLLFPTHVANLPRVYVNENPDGTPSTWSTLDDFGVHPDEPVGDARNFEVFALGGRSLYWGGLSPRAERSELERWGGSIAADLWEPGPDRPGYYATAEDWLGVDHPEPRIVERRLLDLLRDQYPDRLTRSAPVAMRRPSASSWRVPTGLFSTAELLLEQRVAAGSPPPQDQVAPGNPPMFGPPYLHLGELVLGVTRGAHNDWIVETVRIPDGIRTTRRARAVVLCGGTVETPRIMAASRLSGVSELYGRGFTEHAMGYRHFQVPPGSPYHDAADAAHVLSTPGTSGSDWNLQVQLGTDALLDRHLTRRTRVVTTPVRPGWVAGQAVFLGRADIDQAGALQFGPGPWLDLDDPAAPNLPVVTRRYATREPAADWEPVSDVLMAALDARPLDGTPAAPAVALSAPGVVSHEVGTMRIGTDVTTGVVDQHLEVFGAAGLFACDNSVFPTSPSANPSLTLAALALRLADDLFDRFGRSR
jgi:choline dehydrogenase-like flavoprotein